MLKADRELKAAAAASIGLTKEENDYYLGMFRSGDCSKPNGKTIRSEEQTRNVCDAREFEVAPKFEIPVNFAKRVIRLFERRVMFVVVLLPMEFAFELQ